MTAPARRSDILKAIGIREWRLRDGSEDAADVVHVSASDTGLSDPAPAKAVTPVAAEVIAPEKALSPAGNWSVLRQAVAACTACPLHETRTQTVFGTGNTASDWLVVGEAPGSEEDARGEPFIGPAGQLLNEMLLSIGQERSRVYIANVLKCLPPEDRKPLPEEVSACEHFLDEQIGLLKPRIIFAVGKTAATALLGLDKDVQMAKLRGSVHQHKSSGLPVVVTYHPAYLLRRPGDKFKAWQDLLLAREVLERAGQDE